ncbi:MAG: alpha/beta hydrolase [Bacteroidia bacterium]
MTLEKIIFIHGMCVNNEYWKEWINYFDNKGYECAAPPWPMHDGRAAILRKNYPDAALGKLTLEMVLNFYIDLLSKMITQPILIGHSMGGLLVQLLINRGFGKCGIAIHSAPPAGLISFKFSFLASNVFLFNPLKINSPFLMTFKEFQYTNVNGLPLKEQHDLYNSYVIPESINIPRGVFTTGKINFKKTHAPLLLTAGLQDHIIPASLNEKNFKRYKNSNSITHFKRFDGRVHFVIKQEGWKEVADFILEWIKKVENKSNQ